MFLLVLVDEVCMNVVLLVRSIKTERMLQRGVSFLLASQMPLHKILLIVLFVSAYL